MNKEKILKRLQNIESYVRCILEDINKLRTELDAKPKPISKKEELFNQNLAKVLADREKRHRTGADSLRLQNEFNLLVPPHPNRVLKYLATKDPSVFDGLKRK